jgi:hypothetical protein
MKWCHYCKTNLFYIINIIITMIDVIKLFVQMA